jgi:hypothetical protein
VPLGDVDRLEGGPPTDYFAFGQVAAWPTGFGVRLGRRAIHQVSREPGHTISGFGRWLR